MSNTTPKKNGTVEITGLKKKHEFKDDPFLKEKKQRAIEFLKKNPTPKDLFKSKR
jgi:hypothetical protein